jgi:hypothetical protein
MSRWLDVMLEEIRLKQAQRRADREEHDRRMTEERRQKRGRDTGPALPDDGRSDHR